MSNSQTNQRPRRSFAKGADPSASPQSRVDRLKYDGEDVPVLIRLPDLTPQALLRQPAPAAAGQNESPLEPAAQPPMEQPQAVAAGPETAGESGPAAAAELPNPQTAGQAEKTPDAGAGTGETTGGTDPLEAATTSQPATTAAKSLSAGSESADEASSTDDQARGATKTPVGGSRGSSTSSAGAVGRSDRIPSRQRRRPSEQRTGQRNHSKGRGETGRRSGRPGSTAKTSPRQPASILPFDKTRLTVGAGLVLVAGLTYFALRGGGEDTAVPVDAWAGGESNQVASDVQPISEPEMDLWPAGTGTPAAGPEQSVTQHATPVTEPANEPVWPNDAAQPAAPPTATADVTGGTSLPAANYTYNSPPITAPTNGPEYEAPAYTAAGDAEPVTGWPSDQGSEIQPTSATSPAVGWPDSGVTPSATNNQPSGTTNGYYQSQPAGYTTSPEPTGAYGSAPSVRTGRLETATPNLGDTSNTTATSGSQLNGTIEIPRARANHEYNGSSVY